jgi:glycolate oxidase FAD binding subunit
VESGPWSGRDPEVGLATSALNRIERVEPADLTVTAGAGVTLGMLRERLARHGLWWPCDPPGPDGVTVGGVLATGVGGPLASRYGWPRDLTLGLTLVTGDGRTLELGGRVVKNVAGFDLVRLAVGSRGRLGLIVSATLRLFPLPACRRYFELAHPSLSNLLPAVTAVAGLPFLPGGTLLVSPHREGEPWRLRVRLLGSAEGVAARAEALREAVPDLGEVDDDAGAGGDRTLREMEGSAPVAVRVEAAPGEVEELLAGLRVLPGWSGAASPGLVADLLAGSVRAAGGVPPEPEAWGAGLTDLAKRLGERGRIRLVRGPRELTSAVDLGSATGRVEALDRQIRRHFDPGGILGPGRRP